MTDPVESLARRVAEEAHEGQWHHVAFADRPGVFSRGEDEAVRVAEAMGAQFVQQRFGDRSIVWVDLAQQPARLDEETRERLTVKYRKAREALGGEPDA